MVYTGYGDEVFLFPERAKLMTIKRYLGVTALEKVRYTSWYTQGMKVMILRCNRALNVPNSLKMLRYTYSLNVPN